jgi:GT2 family glycosyltransferase
MVIVVDDQSIPSEEVRLRRLCCDVGALYRRLRPPRTFAETLGRRSHARNLGTSVARTDLLLYLDGDMLLTPRYIEVIRHYHAVLDGIYLRAERYSLPVPDQAHGIEACLRKITIQRRHAGAVPLGYISQSATFVGNRAYRRAYWDKWEWSASNNLSVRREHVRQVGYWDEHFIGWGEEDIDLSFRLAQLGLTPILLIDHDAVAYHLDHHVDLEANTSSLRANAEYLIGKFPSIAGARMDAYARYNIRIEDLRSTAHIPAVPAPEFPGT